MSWRGVLAWLRRLGDNPASFDPATANAAEILANTSEAHAMLARAWALEGDVFPPNSGAAAAVDVVEHRYGVRLPEDFRTYQLNTAPEHDNWDRRGAIWWSPDRMRNIPEEYARPVNHPVIAAKAQNCLFFADYEAWVVAWAICCEQGPDLGKIAVIGCEDRWVADSFTDFVRAYILDPWSVV